MGSAADAGSGSNTNIFQNTRRTAWMAARARNAAKRGGLIAAVGLASVAITLLLLVLVPREVNRNVRARIEALPPLVDTLTLQANLTGATDRLKNAEATLQYLRQAEADRVASATANAPGGSDVAIATINAPADQTDARKDLGTRAARARTAPLVENFRLVGEAELLRNDSRAKLLLDSLNEVSRDREAYAALSGADARYAAMTARISTLGQRLLAIAEQRLTASPANNAPSAAPVPSMSRPVAPPTATTPPFTTPPATADSAPRANIDVPADTGTLAQPQRFSGDSIAERLAREALDTARVLLQTAEKALADARVSNTQIAEARARAEADSPARVPPVAMLFAALVTGLAVGFGCAFFIEVKRPRVADAAEVERVTDARVILHTGATVSDRSSRSRRQTDAGVAPVVDAASEAYQLLHITLTGYGDTSREVQVISSDALLGATIGINLAAAAVRDSRTTLLVDANTPSRLIRQLLRVSAGADRQAGERSLQSQLVAAPVGREQTVDTLLLPADGGDDVIEALRAIEADHDFTVLVRDDSSNAAGELSPAITDVILCARVGVTRLEWLITRTAELRAQQHRVRAVLLWATRAPSLR